MLLTLNISIIRLKKIGGAIPLLYFMKHLITILLAVFFLVLLWFYVDKKSGHEQVIERLEKQVEAKESEIDSIQKAYNKIITEKDHAAYLIFKKAQEGANRWEETARQAQQELRNERSRRRAFNDKQTDSLLSVVQ